ncbi:hypothetical protein Glove_168g189 [Diversispora epigaea]|uniref:Uncharacterized protein n=1 Tax=Diversispora epigaea TaxID=1348612 RepID=A0A397IZB1_9GLOM|nr:hypothetical protein Glove_168g189 [Diversispora epigaea]
MNIMCSTTTKRRNMTKCAWPRHIIIVVAVVDKEVEIEVKVVIVIEVVEITVDVFVQTFGHCMKTVDLQRQSWCICNQWNKWFSMTACNGDSFVVFLLTSTTESQTVTSNTIIITDSSTTSSIAIHTTSYTKSITTKATSLRTSLPTTPKSIDTQLNIPSQTTTTVSYFYCGSCNIDTSVNTWTQGSVVTELQPGVFTTITPSTLKTGSNIVLSYKTTIFFSTITKIYRGYTTTFMTTVGLNASSTEVYIPPSTVVIVKKVTAAILFASTKPAATVTVATIVTPVAIPRFLNPFLIGFGTGIGVVVICIAIFVFYKRRKNVLRTTGSR